MNPYVCEATCEVCGEEGMATPRGAAAEWFGGVRHTDPAVCASVLAARERRLREREKALEEKEG